MRSKDICNDNLTQEEKWQKIYGTTNFGNLPSYTRNDHEGHCWMGCPYDTNTSDNRTRAMLHLSASGTLPSKVEHVIDGRSYFMATVSNGVPGYICTYSGCTYRLLNGKPYFYV